MVRFFYITLANLSCFFASMSKLDTNEFHDKVTKEFKVIEESLKTSSLNISQIKETTIKLNKEIESVSHLLPRYQQLSYSQQIQSLLDAIDQKSKPQRRFKFSSRSMVKPDKKVFEIPTGFSHRRASTEPILSHITNRVVHISEKEGIVTDIEDSIIIARDVDSMTFKDIKRSILIVNTKGPIFVNNATDCSIFVNCHQLRIHNTTRTKFVAQIPSNCAIIEGCRDLTFNDDIEVNDFEHPNGNSLNYQTVRYSSEFISLPQRIQKIPEGNIKDIASITSL